MLLFAATAAGPLSAQAQQFDIDRPGFRPGREGEQFKEPPQPKATMELLVPEGGGAAAVPEAEEIKVTLTGVVVEGSTVFRPEQLAPLYQPLLDRRDITLADIYRLSDAVTVMYRDEGFVLSRAVVPAQRITEGVVRLQVIEGFIDRVSVESEELAEGDRLRRLLMSYLDKIEGVKPARIQDIERYLLLINDLSGVQARAVIRPSAGGTGASELVLVTDRRHASGSVTVENYGSKFVGPWQALAEVNALAPFGLGEKLTLRALAANPAQELRFFQGAVSFPVGLEGLTLNLSASRSVSKPGGALEALGVEATTTSVEGSVGYPFIRSRAQNLTALAGVRRRHTSTDIGSFNLTPFTVDRVREAFVNATYDFVDPWGGTTLAGVTFTAGKAEERDLSVNTNLASHGRFGKLEGDALRYQELWEQVSLVLGGQWMLANQTLPAADRIAVGGKQYGRGYDPAEISGDKGVAGKAELRYGGNTDYDYFKAYTLYGFYDFGAVWREDVTVNEKQTLASAGVGAQAAVADWLTAKLEAAAPLTRVPAGESDRGLRLFLSMTASF